jgi:hypothetical protein
VDNLDLNHRCICAVAYRRCRKPDVGFDAATEDKLRPWLSRDQCPCVAPLEIATSESGSIDLEVASVGFEPLRRTFRLGAMPLNVFSLGISLLGSARSCLAHAAQLTRVTPLTFSSSSLGCRADRLSTVPRNALPRWALLISSGLSTPDPHRRSPSHRALHGSTQRHSRPTPRLMTWRRSTPMTRTRLPRSSMPPV